MTPPSPRRPWWQFGVLVALLAGLWVVPPWIARAIEVGQAVRAYTRVIAAAHLGNRSGVRDGCTARYLRGQPLRIANEEGMVGFPRNIDKNFQAWHEGPSVWICPTGRLGPVYQMVPEPDGWKFDGVVALLRPEGLVRGAFLDDEAEAPSDLDPGP